MKISEMYNKLPYDISGSMTKNRFEYELIFGMLKIFDNYEKHEDFSIIFDYVCDIEVHLENELEFYQIKTTNDYKPFNTTFLTTRKKVKDKEKPSIIGKLFSITCVDDIDKEKLKLHLVGNVPFKDEKSILKVNIKRFEDMSDNTKNNIKAAIKSELSVELENLGNLYYVYAMLDLDNYDDTMLGKTLNFYNKVIGIEAKKPKVLYCTLKDLIHQKATFEKDNLTYKELVCNKGITKNDVKKLLDYHKQSNNLIERCIIEIGKRFVNINDRTKMQLALKSIIEGNNSFYEKEKINLRKIVNREFSCFAGTDEEFIKNMMDKHMINYPIEYSFYDKYVFILYEMLKYEEDLLYE